MISCFRFIKIYPPAKQVNSYSYDNQQFRLQCLQGAPYFLIISSLKFHNFYYIIESSLIFSLLDYFLRVSFVGSNKFWSYLSGKKSIRSDGIVSCMNSVIAYNLYDQIVESPLLKTFLISAVRTNCPRWKIGVCFSLSSLSLEQTSFSFDFLEASIGFILAELWIVLLYCFITDWSSLNQSAFPFSTTGFFN